MTRAAVLAMAYGTPIDLDDVDRYYTDIRRGVRPPPELLQELTGRYRAIGGRSPLLEITRAQARGISERVGMPAYVGQKHSPPFVADAMAELQRDGIEHAIGLVLAPHFSTMSVGDYERRARIAADAIGWTGTLTMVESWHIEPGYIEWLAERVRETLSSLPSEVQRDALVVFSAHSLPQRILQKDDPYPRQLAETAEAVARAASVARWRTGWQSAGRTPEAWLGPDILEIIEAESALGTNAIVVCPCGFVADHLEVLYDIDIEAAAAADRAGMVLARTRAPNQDPEFLDAVAAVVRRCLAAAG
ncbi:MAG: ferrochelatase [Actinomycetota bacterium]|nr:ferrochelatase [Actinomycetota bacterium]